MKNYTKLLLLTVGLWIMLSGASFATNASDGDIFILSDENKISKDIIFTEASFSISNLDDSGEYAYYGVDIGIFKKSETGNEWTTLDIERVETNDLNFKIDNFGDITGYEYDNVYVLGYRVLYQIIGSTDGSVEESEWKMVPDSYFIVSAQFISSIAHNQVIRYNYNGFKEVEVVAPDQSGLTGSELNGYNDWNTFIDGDILKYRIRINALKTNEISDIKVNLKFNTLSEPDIILDLKNVLLFKEGDPNPIKIIETSSAKVSDNSYLLDLGDALNSNGDGKYYIEYKARANIDKYSNVHTLIKNIATFTVYNTAGQLITQSGSSVYFKEYIDTKVYKGLVQYR